MDQDESFFREVDEDYRRDQLILALKQYGIYAIAVAFLIICVVGGYVFDKNRANDEAERGGDELAKAINLADTGKADEANKILADLASNGPGNYKIIAKLNQAADLVASGQKDAAVPLYRAIASDAATPPELQDFSRIQVAALTIETESYDKLAHDLAEYRSGTNAWRFSAKEVLGLSAMKNGKIQEAKTLFGEIKSDGRAPTEMRQRAEIMLSVLSEQPKASQSTASGAGDKQNEAKTQ